MFDTGSLAEGALRLRTAVETASGWSRAAIAMAAGAASVLAMAPFFLWPVLFLTLPVMIWLATAKRPGDAASDSHWRAARDGWWFGFGYFFAGLFWIGEAFLVEAEIFGWLMPFAVTIMPAGLALFFAAAFVLVRATWQPGVAGILLASTVIAAVEWLRGHILTGFPWNTIGYALTGNDVLMQSAGVLGIFGLTLWAVLIFSAPLVVLAEVHANAQASLDALATAVGLALIPLAIAATYGLLVLGEAEAAPDAGIRVRVVQPSVPQRDKWQAEKQLEIFEAHEALSRRNERGEIDDLAGINLLVWPEAAMPFRPLDEPVALQRIGELLPDGAHLASGILRVETIAPSGAGETAIPVRRAYNSLAVFDDRGQPVAIYDKIHLVPFGEYLPFQDVLESIGLQSLTRQRGGFATGPSPRPLVSLPGLPTFAGLICYEAIFPSEMLPGTERPSLLINVTNDGWFGNTTGPRQHFHQTRVRAVESGLPLIRAGNNGISAVFDGRGRVLAKLDLNEKGSFDVTMPRAHLEPPYAVWGDAIFALNLMMFWAMSLVIRLRTK